MKTLISVEAQKDGALPRPGMLPDVEPIASSEMLPCWSSAGRRRRGRMSMETRHALVAAISGRHAWSGAKDDGRRSRRGHTPPTIQAERSRNQPIL